MKEQILELIKSNPQLGQAVMAMVQRMSQSQALTPETLQKLIRIFEAVLQKPELYPELQKTLSQVGIDASWLPPEFSETAIVTLLAAMYVMLDSREQAPEMMQEQTPMQPQQMPPQAFARGGLASLAAQGRGGDTQLAHVNPFEAGVLRSMGGSGGINPRTGLREYDLFGDIGNAFSDLGKSVGPALSVIAPMALDYFVPGMGSSIGGAALMGGLGSALGGGNALQGAAAGALGAGLGGTLGNWAGDAMGMELGKAGANTLGSALMGGALGSATGRGFTQGAVGGALGSVLGNTVSGLGGGDTAWGQGVQQAGQSMGNLLSTGSSAREALTGGALAGLARGLTARPSDLATQDYASGPANSTKVDATMSAPGTASSGLSFSKALSAAPVLMTLLGAAETPEQVQTATSSMSPQQQEYFNRASQKWDWDKMRADAAGSGLGLGQYMARNWDKLTADGAYVKPPVKLAQGGLSMLAAGGGSGRDDTIDARLSDGEYVFDAETTALLGDGSVKEGAKRLDEMRARIRQHKGKSLARGKISPDAKSPLSYLKEAA